MSEQSGLRYNDEMAKPNTEGILTVGQVAKILDLTPSGVRWLADTGRLPFSKLGEQRVFSKKDVEKFRKEREKR